VAIIRGVARLDRKTKNLVKRLNPGEIAIIAHEGIDKLAAEGLVSTRTKAVINACRSISDDYPNSGPKIITDAGIPIIDEVGLEIFERVQEEDELEIIEDRIYKRGVRIGSGTLLTPDRIEEGLEKARAKMNQVFERFVDNTLTYAKQEVSLVAGHLDTPSVNVEFKGRHALVVVRGDNYREDLLAIELYIREVKPILIGVDGGADAILEFGLKPDIVIGDMDSVSDRALSQAGEIIVHAYPNGQAPGLARVQALGLKAKTFASPGTSEDIAMLLAYEKGASLIVAVGTHSNMLDFLEKGRKGMASTFLVRLKVGSILVDAKGVSQLYRSPLRPRYLAPIFLAALIPVAIVMMLYPTTRDLLHLLYIQVRVLLGI